MIELINKSIETLLGKTISWQAPCSAQLFIFGVGRYIPPPLHPAPRPHSQQHQQTLTRYWRKRVCPKTRMPTLPSLTCRSPFIIIMSKNLLPLVQEVDISGRRPAVDPWSHMCKWRFSSPYVLPRCQPWRPKWCSHHFASCKVIGRSACFDLPDPFDRSS